MIRSLKSFATTRLKALQSLGVSPDMDFLERKTMEVINLILGFNIPIGSFFLILNIADGQYLLAIFNLLALLGNILVMTLHHFGKIREAKLLISFGFIALFSIQSILFRNGTEYFVFINLIVTLIFYNDRRFIYSMALLNCIAFVGIKTVLNSDFYYSSVPGSRVIFNTAFGIFVAAFSLLYFKYQQAALLAQIQEKNRELEGMNETKEKLFSIIAHDLRSPVAQLKSTLDLLNRDYISPEEFGQMARGLTKQVDDMQVNLDDLLIWSQNQMAGIQASPKNVSVRSTVEEIIGLMKPLANAKSIQLKNLTADIYAWIDPDHLKLVLRNILVNAIKFSYKNSDIEISSETNAEEAVISIRDFGVGMTPDTVDNLFSNSFHSTKGTAQEKGTGLGLKLCREFLQKSNSRLSVTSRKDAGSTFFITIPSYQSFNKESQ